MIGIDGTWQLTSTTHLFLITFCFSLSFSLPHHSPASPLSLPPSSTLSRLTPTPKRHEKLFLNGKGVGIRMVGLSIILEEHKDINKRISQVISRGSFFMKIKPPSTPPNSSSPGPFSRRDFPLNLDECLLCKKKILPGKDIYMYKGDLGFCSVECRCRQISMDEEESERSGCTSEYKYCSLSAMKPQQLPASSSSSGKGSSNRANTFVY